ncbi:endocuticle structural glycoprotein SgAbd-3 [Camponotus floridanus]|uniref:endocuticle structural glycoprotein SgAbd-3 n=1 Tax=Camponotus floridanus TaxID=104421 RepID=UPI00059E1D6B|nr:endocuticle structural glycoprotein SgAbd-3 [Camponotus floridanus]
MNLLIITLCVLIKATVIIAKTERLTTPSNINHAKLALYYTVANYDTTTPTTTPLRQYPIIQPSKPLYNYTYNADTGIQAQESGHLNNMGTNQEALEVRGSYSYTDKEGNTFQVSYIANENGFQPKGAHLPTIPPLIKTALQYISKEEERRGKK